MKNLTGKPVQDGIALKRMWRDDGKHGSLRHYAKALEGNEKKGHEIATRWMDRKHIDR